MGSGRHRHDGTRARRCSRYRLRDRCQAWYDEVGLPDIGGCMQCRLEFSVGDGRPGALGCPRLPRLRGGGRIGCRQGPEVAREPGDLRAGLRDGADLPRAHGDTHRSPQNALHLLCGVRIRQRRAAGAHGDLPGEDGGRRARTAERSGGCVQRKCATSNPATGSCGRRRCPQRGHDARAGFRGFLHGPHREVQAGAPTAEVPVLAGGEGSRRASHVHRGCLLHRLVVPPLSGAA
mmetsp:Transcript_104242/g.264698  ORF Transcript_104242/g.264698 Transcript_104242/m.264698 type:complete len:234 (+) Transcript_104242:467-1168(+)